MIRTISPASEDEWRHADVLITELQEWDFQQSEALGFDSKEVLAVFYPRETEDARRDAASHRGRLLLAMDTNTPIGCAAFREWNPTTCELYNVYLRPTYRGRGVASELLRRLMSDAKALGYETMSLETASFMVDAHKLYKSLGFEVSEPYRSIPSKFASVTLWMKCRLGIGP